MSALACGMIGVSAVAAAYFYKGEGAIMFWLLALFALLGAATSNH